MANDLSLLFQLRARNEASPAIHSVQADVQKLRQTVGSDFGQMQQVATAALGRITSSITGVSSQVPVLGSAVNALSGEMAGLAAGTGQATAGFTALGGPIGIALAGFVATAFAVEKVGVAIFDLTKQTAEFQGKLFDLSQQTGVSVKTLSALEVIAVQTGGSIDSIVASLGIFQKNMEEADDETSKAAQRFKELNVTVTDTEETLRATLLALSRMQEGSKQTATALDLFGRGGKQLLAVLKETNGDLDATIRKLDEVGVLISSETAKAADEFNDQLALLQFQLRGLGAETIPTVLTALQSLSEFLKENRDAFDALGLAIKGVALVFVEPLKGAIILLNHELQTHRREVLLLKTAYESLRDAISGVSTTGTAVSGGVNLQGRSGLALLQEAARAGTPIGPGKPNDDLLRQAGLLNATGGRGSASDDEAAFQRKVNEKINALTAATVRAMAENEAEMVRGIEAAKRRLGEFQLSQTEAIRQGFFGDKSELDKANEFVRFLEQAGLKISEAEIAQIRFDAVLIQSLEHAKELASTLGSIIELTPGPSGLGGLLKDLAGRDDTKPLFDVNEVLGGDAPELDKHIDKVGILQGAYESLASGIASGVGSIIQNFVLMGTVGPQAFRKVLASALATVAAQAGAQAIYHLAIGIAALTPWGAALYGPAALWFKSAALFGSIALGAGLIGRGVAGGAFSEQSTGGGSSTATSPSTAPTKPTPVDIDRNSINLRVVVQRDEGSTVKAFIDNWRSNGAVRTLVQEDR